jgi:hypothetical protein
MKRILIISICVLHLQALYAIHLLNAVIGDDGWKSFCVYEKELTETQKIAAHLQFAEEKLRKNTPEGLTQEQKINRLKLLDDLHAYRLNEKFPVNENSPFEREPTFIDCHGNICAVGYLIEQSAGKEMAENINGIYHNNYILEMHNAALEMWMQENGVTAMDCAMIQPTYSGSSGPSLKDYSNDSLVSLLKRNISYKGKADSCTIAFQVNQKGKLVNSSVVSGNKTLGNAALKYMKKLKYIPYSSWSMYGERNIINPCDIGKIESVGGPVTIKKEFFISRIFRRMHCYYRKIFPEKQKPYEPIVQLKICYGISPPVILNSSVIFIQEDSATHTDENSVSIKMHLFDKANAETLAFATVLLYSDSEKIIAGNESDFKGECSFIIPKNRYKKLKLVIICPGYEKVVIDNLNAVDQQISVQVQSKYYIGEYCDELPCLGTIYIQPKIKKSVIEI